MRDRGRYTQLQDRILKEELADRIGSGLQEYHPGPIRRPPAIHLDEHREGEDIIDTPLNEQDQSEKLNREDDLDMRRPMGDT